MHRLVVLLFAITAWFGPATAEEGQTWVTSWAASVQGPYPVGNPSAQPDQRFAFPTPEANDQTFRLIVRPSLWGREARLRFSNVFGTRSLTLDGVFVGLQMSSAVVVQGTNQPVHFAGKDSVTIPPGEWVWSDGVALPFVADPTAPLLSGRKLAVSFHVAGVSGPMTWHAKALRTSYVTAPGAGSRGQEEGEAAFPFSTASWFFLDALDMTAPAGAAVVVAFGDSITDGTSSTMNGDDRWPDILWRRLHAASGNRISVVNAGIGGNQILGPAEYTPEKAVPGGPAALKRLQRDVMGLSGITAVIWLEGINDFNKTTGAAVEDVEAGMREGVAQIRAGLPGVRVIGATLVSALGSTNPAHGTPEEDTKRKALNDFIRTSGLFDAVVDFDAATLDPQTGSLKPEFVPESTTGGPGDKLHPNRAGYQAMGTAIDHDVVAPR